MDGRMDNITSRFGDIMRRGLCEYAISLGKLPQDTPVDTVSIFTVQTALQDVEYVGKGAEDAALYIGVCIREALEEQGLNERLTRQKGYEIYQNLRRAYNVSHRINIVTGKLSIESLVNMDAKELAPENVKKRRKEEEEKYLKEQVILQNTGPALIRKTHKGLESVLDEESSALNEQPNEGVGEVISDDEEPTHEEQTGQCLDGVVKKAVLADEPDGPACSSSKDETAKASAKNEAGARMQLLETPWDVHAVKCEAAMELYRAWTTATWAVPPLLSTKAVPDPTPMGLAPVLDRLVRRFQWLREAHPPEESADDPFLSSVFSSLEKAINSDKERVASI